MENNSSKEVRRAILCAAAGLLMSVNIRSFVHTGGLLPGGFSGLSLLIQQIISRLWGTTVPYGPIYFLLNLFPIILSFKKIGKKFTIFSCVTILINSTLTDFIPLRVITYDVLLISIFGGIINGFAVSMCLRAGATSGGTDFIAIYASEKFGIDTFNYVLIFNAIILSCDGILFGWDKALYSIIFQFTSTQVIHLVYKRYTKYTLFIVTDRPKEVTDAIYAVTGHGATDIHAFGSYADTPRTLVYSVVSGDDTKKIVQRIKILDDKAFINVVRTESLSGKFWMRPND